VNPGLFSLRREIVVDTIEQVWILLGVEMAQSEVVIVLTNAPDLLLAKRIAHLLIEEHLAACINIGQPMLSVYGWKGDVEGAQEIPMTIKTTTDKQEAMIARLVELHPYDIPEAVIVPTVGGHTPYLDWVRSLTQVQQKSN
jgi:periplasmic divalent cation tolerance protein